MNIVGEDFLRASVVDDGYFLKLILNERTAHFFAHTTEHRDASLPGLRYRDDSLGDAVAATIKGNQIDVRKHKAYSQERMQGLITALEAALDPILEGSIFTVNYGGVYLTTIGRR